MRSFGSPQIVGSSDEKLQADEAFSPRLVDGIRLLYQALRYALDLGRDPWDFAVEGSVLRRAGLDRSDLRWLVCRHFVEHASEVTARDLMHRAFRPEADLVFCRTTCFVLTAQGAAFAEQTGAVAVIRSGASEKKDEFQTPLACLPSPTPVFLYDLRELRFKDLVVKRFKLPSPNQEAILAAFEEEKWPRGILDPLPPRADMCPKQRLLDTIKSLNRNQTNPLLHFSGDGTGARVCWEPVGEPFPSSPHLPRCSPSATL